MALIVHKYGGTSMGSTERIRSVAKRVAKWVRAGHQLVVVPSAMSGETNRLLGLAKELFPGVMSMEEAQSKYEFEAEEPVSLDELNDYFNQLDKKRKITGADVEDDWLEGVGV